MSDRLKKRNERVLVMLDQEELHALDSWRFEHRMPSRSAAVRELLRQGLGNFGAGSALAGEKSSDFGVLQRSADDTAE